MLCHTNHSQQSQSAHYNNHIILTHFPPSKAKAKYEMQQIGNESLYDASSALSTWKNAAHKVTPMVSFVISEKFAPSSFY